MARELKIKIKNDEGKLEFRQIQLPSSDKIADLQKTLKKAEEKFGTKSAQSTKIIRETREYELITPLFGGGVETKKADEVSVIRATEIRGHLRFWWRATRGGQFETIEDLKKHEDAIFGSTDQHSALQIEVEIINRGRNFPDQRDTNNQPQPIHSTKSPFSYVAFPLRDETNARVIENVSFKMRLCFPAEFEADLRDSLWAWETFGGIGARTRRGFGALSLKSINNERITLPRADALQSAISDFLNKFEATIEVTRHFPLVTRDVSFRLSGRQDSAIKVWKFLADKLQSFRQYRKDKNSGQVSRFGTSQWSEPDALRYRMNIRNSRPDVDKFPRANFGLPILFEMRHDNFKTTLKGKGNRDGEFIERLSSPLILRPIKCSDGYVGLALILETPRTPPNGLFLTDVEKENAVSADLTRTEAQTLTRRLEILNNKTDVLQAFLDYLER